MIRHRGRRCHLGLTICVCLLVLVAACRSEDPVHTKADALRRGDAFFEAKRYIDAIAAYRQAVEADPHDGQTRLKLAKAHQEAQQWDDALRQFVGAADLLPDDFTMQLSATGWLLGMERFVDAYDRAVAMARTAPDDPRVLVLVASARSRLGSSRGVLVTLDEAMRQGRSFDEVLTSLRRKTTRADNHASEEGLRRALAIDPRNADARLTLVSLLWTTNRLDEGGDLLKQEADGSAGDAFLQRVLGLFYAHRGRDAEAEKYLTLATSSKDRASELSLADFYIAKERWAEALPMLETMAAGADPDAEAALRAADVELKLGKRDQGLRRAEHVLSRTPSNPRAQRIKAAVLLADGQTGPALRLAESAVSGAPSSSEAHHVLAKALVTVGDLERAFNELSEAWRLKPESAELAGELASVAVSLGRDQIAVEFARQSLRLDPRDRGASIALVRALVRTGDLYAADQALAPLLTRDGSSVDVLASLAALQAARGGHDLAKRTYLRALQANRDSLEALSGLVAVELGQRQFAEARTRVNQAVAAHPGAPPYLLLAAKVARATGDVRQEEAHLRAILATDPGHVQATLFLTDAYARQNTREAGKQVLERALEHRPTSVELQLALASLQEDMGQISDAQKRYERIVGLNVRAPIASARLARLYANQGDNLEVALGLASAAKQQMPDEALVSDALGWVYVRTGLPVLGMPHLQAAVRVEPANPTFHYHLGMAYLRTRQRTKAREVLEHALALNPSFADAPAARAALKTLGEP